MVVPCHDRQDETKPALFISISFFVRARVPGFPANLEVLPRHPFPLFSERFGDEDKAAPCMATHNLIPWNTTFHIISLCWAMLFPGFIENARQRQRRQSTIPVRHARTMRLCASNRSKSRPYICVGYQRTNSQHVPSAPLIAHHLRVTRRYAKSGAAVMCAFSLDMSRSQIRGLFKKLIGEQ